MSHAVQVHLAAVNGEHGGHHQRAWRDMGLSHKEDTERLNTEFPEKCFSYQVSHNLIKTFKGVTVNALCPLLSRMLQMLHANHAFMCNILLLHPCAIV